MRTTLIAGLLAAFLSNPVLGSRGPGGGQSTPYGYVDVVNECDDAVVVRVAGGEPLVMEPQEVVRTIVVGDGGPKMTADVSAELAADSAVRAEETCAVSRNKLTVVRIQSAAPAGKIELSIVCDRPVRVAQVDRSRSYGSHESQVALCSSGGMLSLLALGVWLGRAPRRPQAVCS
jgi:hypothetical protein